MDNKIKVLIIDDERLVRTGLITTVNWEKFDMHVVSDAPNGEIGWQQFLEHRPELVITDIVMSQMNGIDLALNIKETAPETKILLLSCYSDFAYAQQAIRFGISGYVLKTQFSDEEMEGYLSRIQTEILSEREQNKKSTLSVPSRNEPDLGHALCVWFGQSADPNILIETIGILQSQRNWLLEDAKLLLITHEESGHRWLGDLQNLFLRALPEEDYILADYGNDLCFVFYNNKLSNSVENTMTHWKLLQPKSKWRQTERLYNKRQWLDQVERLYRLWEIEQNYYIRKDQYAEAILKAITYIEMNLHSPLQVSDIADIVGLSRSHFSTLFKKLTGENVIQFIFSKRLEQASQLLLTTDWKVNEISKKIGMPDYKYFSKWFKKCTGQTPSDFRNQTKIGSI
jgi:two-component system response regulator YesN